MAFGVIFDLDGCLVDSEPLALEAIAAEMRHIGIKDATAAEIGERFLGIGMSVVCDYVTTRLGAACPSDFPENVELKLFESYRTKLRVMPGVGSFMTSLKNKGIPCGIATGGSKARLKFTLEVSGLQTSFMNTACSVDDVKRGKPAPDLFLLAAQKIGVPPQNCIVLEDSPHGVRGAKAAGMHPYGFLGGTHLSGRQDQHRHLLTQAGALKVCDSFKEFSDLVFETEMLLE